MSSFLTLVFAISFGYLAVLFAIAIFLQMADNVAEAGNSGEDRS